MGKVSKLDVNLYIEAKKKHRTQALKRYLLLDPPNYLIINLKRFAQMGISYIKNSKKIAFPMILNLDPYMIHKIPKTDIESFNLYHQATTS